jgi:hypothetical protein
MKARLIVAVGCDLCGVELTVMQLPGSLTRVVGHGKWRSSGEACPNEGKLFTAPSMDLAEVKLTLESR